MYINNKKEEIKDFYFVFENIDYNYNENIWILKDLKEYEEYKDIKNNSHNGIIDFSLIENKYIQNELKGYFYFLINEKKLKYNAFNSYIRFLKNVQIFLNIYINNKVYSILELNKNLLIEEYIIFLENKGLKTTKEYEKLTQNMIKEKKQSKADIVYIFENFFDYIDSLKDKRPELEKDIWNIKNLKVKVLGIETYSSNRIDFTKIPQTEIRKTCKKYIYQCLQNKKIKTVSEYLLAINQFFIFIYKNHSEINLISEINRDIIKEYLLYMKTSGLGRETYSKRIKTVKLFFDKIQLMGFIDLPKETLIFDSDSSRKLKTNPKFFSDNELKQMNKHINELPIQIARMFFVIENLGIRISDLQFLEDSCLKQNKNNEYSLKYFQPKTNKWNTIPIDEVVATTIKEAIKYSKQNFGEECKYVFASTKDKPINSNSFSYYLNKMSYNNNLLMDDGSPLRIKSHTFRGTVASYYANLGIELDIIRQMLGQDNIGVLKHYITIHSSTMIDNLSDIINEENEYIANIGHIENIKNISKDNYSDIPLSNGYCTKSLNSGLCEHANSCYACRMFKASKDCLDLYKRQLIKANNNIEIAKINGYERLLEINVDLSNSLVKIITSIENKGEI